MSSDRELLELAAKAAGGLFVPGEGGEDDGISINGAWSAFAPLTDDGDALRLAVKLKLDICRPFGEFEGVCVWLDHKGDFIEEPHGDDPCAATRRAIVRAAAEIGRSEG